MKITFFSTMEGSPWGGSEDLWYGVALLALKREIQVQVCVKEWSNVNEKIKLLEGNGAQVVFRENSAKISWKKLINRVFYSKTRIGYQTNFNIGYPAKIKNFNPDSILVSQGSTFDFFSIKYLCELIDKNKIPYSVICQWNTENGGILRQSVKDRIKNIFPWSNYYFVSNRNLLTAQRQFGGNLENSKVVSNVTDFDNNVTYPWPKDDTNARLKLACIARLDCSTKGQDILLQTLSENCFKDISYELNFYGSGPDQEHLKTLVKYYELEEKVFFRGHVSNRSEIWENNHLLILPSISEGTPLALQECMLLKRPALVTDVGGNDELIINNATGFLCPVSSVNALKTSLMELFNTPIEKLKEFGENAFRLANEKILLNSAEIILNDMIKSATPKK